MTTAAWIVRAALMYSLILFFGTGAWLVVLVWMIARMVGHPYP